MQTRQERRRNADTTENRKRGWGVRVWTGVGGWQGVQNAGKEARRSDGEKRKKTHTHTHAHGGKATERKKPGTCSWQ